MFVDTTFTSFMTRTVCPGIRVLSNARLWLDNVSFRNINLLSGGHTRPDVSAIVAYSNVQLVLVVRQPHRGPHSESQWYH